MNIGDIYLMNDGEVEIVNFSGWNNVKIRFLKSGYEAVVSTTHIKNKNVRDRFKPTVLGIGFIGGTKNKSSNKGNPTRAYQCWKSMLNRCYNEVTRNNYPTYQGCTVCEEWYNFQNFADWFYKNHPSKNSKNGKSYELDKDIKINGNKIYGPDTCLLIDHEDNVRTASCKKYKIIDPEGKTVEIVGMRKFSIERGLDPSSMTKVSKGILKYHKGWTTPIKLNDGTKNE